jgi:hypothetical protein
MKSKNPVKPQNHVTLSKQTKYKVPINYLPLATIEVAQRKAPDLPGAFPVSPNISEMNTYRHHCPKL